MEHGFAGEEPANGHTVDAAHQLAVLPAFNAVGVAEVVKRRVSLDKLGTDPGALPAGRRPGASLHDLAERAVGCDFENVFANDLRQASRGVEAIQFKNCARIVSPPGDWIVSPGKYPVAIRQQESRRGQVSAHGDQTVVWSAVLRRARVGEPETLGEENGQSA